MASAMSLQWLLKLPPALRCEVIKPLNARTLAKTIRTEEIVRNRPFSTLRSFQARQTNPKKPPFKKPPPPPSTSAKPTTSTSTQQSKPQPSTWPTATQPSRVITKMDVKLRSLLESTNEILIYRASSHTSYFVNSYLLGAAFIAGGVAQGGLGDPARMPWYIQTMTLGVALAFAAIGTVFILGPSKMIRSIHLVAPPGGRGSAILRFQTKSSLPFTRGLRGSRNIIETRLNEATITQEVFGEDIPFRNVPFSEAERFTNHYVNELAPTVRERISRLGDSIRRMPSALWQDTRRMFLRDAFAYVEIPGREGHWKLDLHGAYLLDEGRPLRQVMVPVLKMDRSWIRWVRGLLGF